MINHVYIHIPFCIKKCGYCSFFSTPFSQSEVKKYLSTLKQEISNYLLSDLTIKPVTLYFGGGTPSLLDSQDIAEIISLFDLSMMEECTIEVNPATINNQKIKQFSKLPINRISIGTQSFIDNELQLMGRLHTVHDNVKTYDLFREAGFENISIDILYGIPHQKISAIKEYLPLIKLMQPNHVSTYCLSLENDNLMFEQTLDDETSASIYRCLQDTLTDLGYIHYELSNFAKEHKESKHNLGYWKMNNYIGFGAAAHSFVGNKRYHNPSSLYEYYQLTDNKEFFPNCLVQSPDELMSDYVIQRLRLTEGININEFNCKFNDDFYSRYKQILEKFYDYLIIDKHSVSLSPDYLFVSNEILTGFLL